MSKDCKALIDLTRTYLREASPAAVSGSQWSDAILTDYLNEAVVQLFGDILEADEDYFGFYTDLDFVSGVAVYDLPPGFVRMQLVEYIAGGGRLPILEARASDADPEGLGIGLGQASGQLYTYALYGDQIHFDPPSGGNVTAAVRMWHVRKPPDLIYGVAVAGTASTIRFQNATTLTGVAAAPNDDAYNTCWVSIVSGTGAGQRRRIADYSGANQTATVSPNWSTVPDTTSVYALETMIPEPYDRLPALLAAVFAYENIDQDSSELKGRANAMNDRLIAAVEQRTRTERRTEPWDPDDGVFPTAFA